MSDQRPRQQIISTQKAILTDFIKENPKLQSGRFESNFSFKDARNLWESVANSLNAVPGGATKDWRQWRKTWQDLKKNVKAKASANKRYSCGTGGGGPPPTIGGVEKDILNIISPVVIDGIEDVNESNVTFEWVDVMNNTSVDLEDTGDCDKIMEQSFIVEDTSILDHDYMMMGPSTSMKGHHPLISMQGNNTMDEGSNVATPTRRTSPAAPRSSIAKNVKRKTSKSKRLESSLNISKKLVGVLNKRNDVIENYYHTKTAYMNHRIKYETRKLEIMEQFNKTSKQILDELKFLRILKQEINKNNFI